MKSLSELFTAFCIALTFLTRLPLPSACFRRSNAQSSSLSTQFYPLVGMLIGGLLFALAMLMHTYFASLNPVLNAVFILIAWVGVTGALHMDGFADCIDAASASHATPGKILFVLKDPHIGTMAVVALILLLMLKVALLVQLVAGEYWLALFVAPLVARFLALIYMRSTAYVSTNGLASDLLVEHYDVSMFLQGFGIIVLLYGLTDFFTVLWLVAGLLLCLMYWRRLWLRRIKGYTGDCVGALIEIVEVLFLFLFILLN